MKAIVLTCDRFRAVTDHMIFKYARLWPGHPFRFRVPHQELARTIAGDRVEYRKTPSPIKATVLALLADLDDDELIYWCIDDKYPIRLDVPRIERMLRWLAGQDPSTISGLLFCRCRKMWDRRFLTGRMLVDDDANVYLERTGYAQIWLHQFLRVKVLRHLFEAMPDSIPVPRAMDQLKERIAKPLSHRIFVGGRNAAVFGESTSYGVLTQNCYRSILENGLAPPGWCSTTTGEEIVMGSLES